MTNQPPQITRDPDEQIKRLIMWTRILAVLFRILIIAGLIILVAIIASLTFLDAMDPWLLIIPLGLIALGIILARLEYHHHKRLYAQQNSHRTDEGKNLEDADV